MINRFKTTKILILVTIFLLIISFAIAEKGRLRLFTPQGAEITPYKQKTWPTGPAEITWSNLDSEHYCTVEGQWYIWFWNELGGYVYKRNVHYVNWDADIAACKCDGDNWPQYGLYQTDKTTDWNSAASTVGINQIGGRCCGDDGTSDSGFLVGEKICVNNNDWEWEWIVAGPNQGDVYYVNTGYFEVLSDGDKWVACKVNGLGNYNGVSVIVKDIVDAGNQYSCYKSGVYGRFYECKGSGSTTNQGKIRHEKTTGQSIPGRGNFNTYWCASYGDWIDDLDLGNQETCETTGELRPGEPYDWTGGGCCGDWNPRYYNDAAYQQAGCWFSEEVPHNTRVNDTNVLTNGNFDDYPWVPSTGEVAVPKYWTRTRSISYYRKYTTSTVSGVALNLRSSGTKLYSSYIRIDPLMGYNLSVYYMGGGLVQAHWYNSAKTYLGEQIFVQSTSTDGWEHYVGAFNPPSNAAYARIELNTNTLDNAYFDEIGIYPSYPNIMNYQGQFYGCNYGGTIGDAQIISQNSCQIKGNYYCDPADSVRNYDAWDQPTKIDGLEKNTVKSEYNDPTNQGCCPASYCWNGTTCVASADPNSGESSSVIIVNEDNRWACVNGNWENLTAKLPWDMDINKQGFCLSDSQCLVDKDGVFVNNGHPEYYSGLGDRYDYSHSPNPQCINNTQYLGDHYCDNGKWTSRTKYIALQLLKLVEGNNDYSIFCDFYDNVLNDYNYNTVLDYLLGTQSSDQLYRERPDIQKVCSPGAKFPCTNNFCVLKYFDGTEKVVFGTSLNQPIDASTSFLKTFGHDNQYCNAVTGSLFKKCQDNNKIWYNPQLNAVIFSRRHDISLTTPSDLQFLKNQYIAMIDALIGTQLGATEFLNWSKQAQDFKRIYIAKLGSKTIKGFIQSFHYKDYKTLMLLDYAGFNTDICDSIQVFKDKEAAEQIKFLSVYCDQTDNTYLLKREYNTNAWHANYDPIWINLTAPIRLQPS